jgi:hypothetical protein
MFAKVSTESGTFNLQRFRGLRFGQLKCSACARQEGLQVSTKTAPFMFNLGFACKCVVSFTPSRFTPGMWAQSVHSLTAGVGPGAALDFWRREKSVRMKQRLAQRQSAHKFEILYQAAGDTHACYILLQSMTGIHHNKPIIPKDI